MVTKGFQQVASSWLRPFSSSPMLYDSEPTANSNHSLVYQACNPRAKNDQPFGAPLTGLAGKPDDTRIAQTIAYAAVLRISHTGSAARQCNELHENARAPPTLWRYLFASSCSCSWIRPRCEKRCGGDGKREKMLCLEPIKRRFLCARGCLVPGLVVAAFCDGASRG